MQNNHLVTPRWLSIRRRMMMSLDLLTLFLLGVAGRYVAALRVLERGESAIE